MSRVLNEEGSYILIFSLRLCLRHLCLYSLSPPPSVLERCAVKLSREYIYIFRFTRSSLITPPTPPHANLRVGDDGGGFRVALLLALAAACCDAREYRFKRENEGERDEMLVQCEKRAGLRHEMRGWIISISFFFSRLHSLSFVVLARIYTM